MNVFQALILGIIQGLTEFLPVSSSGHLMFVEQILGIEEVGKSFTVVLHLGTLVSVCLVFYKELIALIKKPFQRYVLLLVISTLPVVLAALLLEDYIDQMFNGGVFLAIGFFLTAAILWISDKFKKCDKTNEQITKLDALLIGVGQMFAIMPGLSRSGTTIAVSLSRKVSRQSAAQYSFLLSVPAILGASVLMLKDIVDGSSGLETISPLPLIFGFIAAMLSGLLAIRFMLKLIRRAKLRYFSYYVAALGLFVMLDQFALHIFFQ